jgi:hypothetical protein
MLTVLFSALGPLLFASAKTRVGSYLPLFRYLGLIAVGLAAASWLARLPEGKTEPVSSDGAMHA